MTRTPILAVGTFGTHLISSANGRVSFVGTVPCDLGGRSYASESEGVAAFVDWFNAQDAAFQREHIASVRNDVFALILAA